MTIYRLEGAYVINSAVVSDCQTIAAAADCLRAVGLITQPVCNAAGVIARLLLNRAVANTTPVVANAVIW